MKLFDVRDDCKWYGADCGDGEKCDTTCFEATPFEDPLAILLRDRAVIRDNKTDVE